MDHFPGDDFLSGSERHLWSLCYSTLEKFGCLVIFKVRGPDVRVKLDRIIEFFVPGNHPRAVEIKTYVEEELRSEIMASEHVGDEWRYGCKVRVHYFSGVDYYLTREQMEPLIAKSVESFMEQLSARTRKPN